MNYFVEMLIQFSFGNRCWLSYAEMMYNVRAYLLCSLLLSVYNRNKKLRSPLLFSFERERTNGFVSFCPPLVNSTFDNCYFTRELSYNLMLPCTLWCSMPLPDLSMPETFTLDVHLVSVENMLRFVILFNLITFIIDGNGMLYTILYTRARTNIHDKRLFNVIGNEQCNKYPIDGDIIDQVHAFFI